MNKQQLKLINNNTLYLQRLQRYWIVNVYVCISMYVYVYIYIYVATCKQINKNKRANNKHILHFVRATNCEICTWI